MSRTGLAHRRTPYEFRDSEEIVRRLLVEKDTIAKEFNEQSLKQMIKLWVGSNTCRLISAKSGGGELESLSDTARVESCLTCFSKDLPVGMGTV
jgi:hypothetical protein